MRTRYFTATSLDGYIADSENSLDWLFAVDSGEATDGEDGGAFGEFLAGIGAMAMGATTYEWLLEHEGILDAPEKWRQFHGEIPCWVFTHRDLPIVPGADIVLAQDVEAAHAQMRERAGELDGWVAGGGDLAGQFADRGLLDEIGLTVAPVTLGAGAPLLPRRLTSERLELVDVTRRGQFAQLTYRLR